MPQLNIAIIGAGDRGGAYAQHLLKDECVRLLAIVEPDPRREAQFLAKHGAHSPKVFADHRQLLSGMVDDLDGVVITAPNCYHRKIAVDCLQAGMHMLLEKPIATTVEDSKAIVDAVAASGRKVSVGFVLRHTPFYRKVKEIVDSGTLGDLLLVNAEELVSAGTTGLFTRTWRRLRSLSGNFLLEKCAHDLDIFNWILGAQAVRVSSFGHRTHLNPRPEVPDVCGPCHEHDICPYYFGNADDPCVYNNPGDIFDHQVTAIDYDNEAVAGFSAILHGSVGRRTIHLLGTKGRLYGDIEDSVIRLELNKPRADETIKVFHGSSGHHGGDAVIAEDFLSQLFEGAATTLGTVEDAYQAALIAEAADRSVIENRTVSVQEVTS